MSTEIYTAALLVRDLQEAVDKADIHGNHRDYLTALGDLGKARAQLERLNREERERRNRIGGAA